MRPCPIRFYRKVDSRILLQHFFLVDQNSILVGKSKHFVKHQNPKITLPKILDFHVYVFFFNA
jgi:hypothetical protein